jgi:hypothetical protein
MDGRQQVAFLSYLYVPQIFVFVQALEFFVQLFEAPDTIYLVAFVSGNFLKLLHINISWFVGQSASHNNSCLNKEFSLNKNHLISGKLRLILYKYYNGHVTSFTKPDTRSKFWIILWDMLEFEAGTCTAVPSLCIWAFLIKNAFDLYVPKLIFWYTWLKEVLCLRSAKLYWLFNVSVLWRYALG